jgi:hypothetical protein
MARIVSFPRGIDRPRELPELRAALVSSAEEGGIWQQAEFERLLSEIVGDPAHHETTKEGHRLIMGPQGYSAEDMNQILPMAIKSATNNLRWYRELLPDAQLIHIDEKMCDFVVAAAEAVPPSLTIHMDDAPAPVGLVVFAKAMEGTDAGPVAVGAPVTVNGLMWGPVHLPGREVPWFVEPPDDDTGVDGISIASFHLMEAQGRVPQVWVGLGRTDWPWGDRVDDQLRGAIPDWSELKQKSLEEDRRLLAAIWATINQKRLVHTEIVLPDKHTRKRLERGGMGDVDNDVLIVHLRKTEYHMLDSMEGTGNKLQFRIPVKPHYKRQPYGPRRALRKIILVPRHWRGPDDAPIRHIERIWEVDR